MPRHFLEGCENSYLVCQGCGVKIWPRLGSYWFLLMSPRGRCRFPGARELKAVLCGPCGRRVRDACESQGLDPEAISRCMTGGPE
jgi:hypothetical protein